MDYENILIDTDDSIQTITINRPSKLNALNKSTIEELSKALQVAENNNELRVIILTGAGEKAFVAGADISEFAHFAVEEGKALSKKGHHDLFNRIDHMKTPVIAAVNGFAFGGDSRIWWYATPGSDCRKRKGHANGLICRND